jgi:hypothetical protein
MTHTLLYVPRNSEHDKNVMAKIANKSGITQMLDYADPAELINAANEVFQKLEQEARN